MRACAGWWLATPCCIFTGSQHEAKAAVTSILRAAIALQAVRVLRINGKAA